MEDEEGDRLAPRIGVDGRRAGIPAGRADDGDMHVTARQEPFEQEAEQLKRHILEGECRPVEQLQQPVAMVKLHQRRDPRMVEDRKSVVEGTSVSVRVGLGGRRLINKTKINNNTIKQKK